MSSDILDVREAASYLKLNEQTVRRLARNHQMPAFKAGGTWRFRKAALDEWAKAQEKRPKRKHILVVDDDKGVLRVLEGLLAQERIDVSIATGGRAALNILEEEIPDLVLLDLKMPDMNGVQVLREIRHRWDHLPVVILTGFPESELMRQALQYSPVTFLSKPFRSEQLLRTLHQLLGKH